MSNINNIINICYLFLVIYLQIIIIYLQKQYFMKVSTYATKTANFQGRRYFLLTI